MRLRIIGGIFCAFIVFCLCFFGSKTVSKSFEETLDSIQNALDMAEQKESLGEGIKQLTRVFQKHKKSFGTFLKHSDVDEMEKKLLEVEDAYKNGSTEDIRNALYALQSAIFVIKDGEKPIIENIF